MSATHVINRQATLDKAIRSAQRLAAKHGREAFAVTEDRAMGGDFAPYAVVTSAAAAKEIWG